jgi:hypothetical protein
MARRRKSPADEGLGVAGLGDRPHKAFVVCSDEEWQAFRVVVLEQGKTVQGLLGELVVREVKRYRRDKLAKLKRQKARRAEYERLLAEDRG